MLNVFTEHSPAGSAGKSKVETTQGALSESGNAAITSACVEKPSGLSSFDWLSFHKKKFANQSAANVNTCGVESPSSSGVMSNVFTEHLPASNADKSKVIT